WHTSYAENHDRDALKRIYAHDKVITRDELPAWPPLVEAEKTSAISSGAGHRAAGFELVREAGGIRVTCGESACGALSLVSLGGRTVWSGSDLTGIVTIQGVRTGVYSLRSANGADVRQSKVFIEP
ncbi:MAG: hypothetical protein AAB214_00685, partial [Fibrobacterota bacterium]